MTNRYTMLPTKIRRPGTPDSDGCNNQVNGLVIGTGDLSELALLATYNGDHMSMYGVNAGVPKPWCASW